MNASDIDTAYVELGYDLGWFFLLTPEASLRTAKIITVGLNPGGSDAEKSAWDFKGNAYFDGDWTKGNGPNAIQRQMRAMYKVLGVGADEVMAAQFVPFRSPSWSRLDRRPEAVAFGMRLWEWVLSVSPAKLIICLGHEVTHRIVDITKATKTASEPTGWGSTHFIQYLDPKGRVIIDLPHPSRYRVFGRKDGKSDLSERSFRALAHFD